MARSTGIVLTAGMITFGNEWIQTNDVNFRVLAASAGAALFTTAVESINEKAGVGLGVMILIVAIMTPFNGKSPAEELVALTQPVPKVKGKLHG